MSTILKCYLNKELIEAGCDEAGRGSLVGPVFAAAVIMPMDYFHPDLNDSKLLSALKRNKLRTEIEREAMSYAIGIVDHKEIDLINIFKASMKAMNIAVLNLKLKPDALLIDGNRFINHCNIPHTCIIKGDGKYTSIAAASVLAKTYRDEFMEQLHTEYSCYNWKKNKGYGTREHRTAISRYGLSPYHRRSFKTDNSQLEIAF